MEGFPFVHRETVRFRDLDGMGHVNNAVFSTYLEQARLAWFGSDDRMPLSVPRTGWEAWLDPGMQNPDAARELLDFTPRWIAMPVSDAVNSVRNNGPELIEPARWQPLGFRRRSQST